MMMMVIDHDHNHHNIICLHTAYPIGIIRLNLFTSVCRVSLGLVYENMWIWPRTTLTHLIGFDNARWTHDDKTKDTGSRTPVSTV